MNFIYPICSRLELGTNDIRMIQFAACDKYSEGLLTGICALEKRHCKVEVITKMTLVCRNSRIVG